MHQIGIKSLTRLPWWKQLSFLEAGLRGRFDKLIVVTCRPEQKVSRYAARSSMPETLARAEVERRSKAQLSDDDKVRRADLVVDNSGPLELTRHRWRRSTLSCGYGQAQRPFEVIKQ